MNLFIFYMSISIYTYIWKSMKERPTVTKLLRKPYISISYLLYIYIISIYLFYETWTWKRTKERSMRKLWKPIQSMKEEREKKTMSVYIWAKRLRLYKPETIYIYIVIWTMLLEFIMRVYIENEREREKRIYERRKRTKRLYESTRPWKPWERENHMLYYTRWKREHETNLVWNENVNLCSYPF